MKIPLDSDKDRWVKAIKQDGLPLHHISELKGRESQIVKQYRIGPIPYAVLLDSNRKILFARIDHIQLEKQLNLLL